MLQNLTSITDLENDTFWAPLRDKANYDFRYVVSGLLGNTAAVNSAMLSIVNFYDPENKKFDLVDPLKIGRGDCIALIDVDTNCYKDLGQEAAIEKVTQYAYRKVTATKYAAIFAPTVTYASVDSASKFNNNKTFPASFHYLACAARSSERYNE